MSGLFQVTTPTATGGIRVTNDVVVYTAPILRYMHGWSLGTVREFCLAKRYDLSEVK